MITDLIAKGLEKIREQEQLRHDREQADREAQQAEVTQQAAELEEILMALFPDELREYIGLCTELPVQQSGDALYRIEAPECTAISFKIHREWMQIHDDDRQGYHFSGLGKFRPHEYSQDRDSYTFMVDMPGVVQDEEKGYVVQKVGDRGINDLEIALAYAHVQQQRIAELQAEADARNKALAEKQARKREQKLLEDIAQAEADLQLAKMMDDAIMGPLLSLVNAIMQERADLNQRIADMDEAMASGEYYHSEAISRLEKRVSDEARKRSEAEQEAQEAQWAASDAEEKLRREKKKAGIWTRQF